MNTTDAWPAGKTWIFQGTVAEDATAGTHVCTLTVTPGTGNELEVLYGVLLVGNTATSQIAIVYMTDGTNVVGYLTNSEGASDTVANTSYAFPTITQTVVPATTTFQNATMGPKSIVSGTMQLVLKVTTTAISVTQTFAVACRIKDGVPTATLADTVGTPVLTTNTNRVF